MKTPIIPVRVKPVITDPPPTGERFDRFGVGKVYLDASSPVYASMDMANARKYPLDNWQSTFAISTETVPGGHKAWDFGGTGRLSLWSPDNKPWGNVEMTLYVKFTAGPTSNSTRIAQPYIGGGHHHTDAATACEGNAMKVGLYGAGNVAHRKEICHECYCTDRGPGNNWGGNPHGTAVSGLPISNMRNGNLLGRWYGFKIIQILMSDRNRIECWIDEGADDGTGRLVIAGNETRWRLLTRYDDVATGKAANGAPIGDWTASSSEFADCTSCQDGTTNTVMKRMANGLVRLVPWGVTHGSGAPNHDFSVTNAAACQFRTDSASGAAGRIAFYSAREINPASRF